MDIPCRTILISLAIWPQEDCPICILPAPFGEQVNPEARKGIITLSSGRAIKGQIATTREKPIRIWDDKDKVYRDVPLTLVKTMEAEIVWERDEKEFHFKESGSDIKEFTGKSYPARELVYKVTLAVSM